MANNIIKRVWNQGSMTPIEDLQGSAFTNENGGHTFQISGVDSNGEALALSGTVAASFLRPDQTTVGISGSVSGGVASVTLSEECYGIPGRFGLVIFLTSDGKKTAIYSCVGNVARSSTDAVAPGVVADVVDLINEIQAAVDTIPASYSALMADIAPTYSSSALYAVGYYAWYEGDLKRCIVPITVGETYTPAHWTSAVVGDDVCALKSAIKGINAINDNSNKKNTNVSFFALEKGYIAIPDIGAVVDVTTKIDANYFSGYLQCNPGDKLYIKASGTGHSSARVFCFCGNDYKVIQRAGMSTIVDGYVIAPENTAFAVVNLSDTTSEYAFIGEPIYDIVKDLPRIESLIDYYNLFDSQKVTTGKALKPDGSIVNASTLYYSDYIPVTAGKKYRVSQSLNSTSRGDCWYDSSKTYISGEASTGLNSRVITAPNNAAYLRVSGITADINGMAVYKTPEVGTGDIENLQAEIDTTNDRIDSLVLNGLTPVLNVIKSGKKFRKMLADGDNGGIDDFTYCAFSSGVIYKGKEIHATRIGKQHTTPEANTDWGKIIFHVIDLAGNISIAYPDINWVQEGGEPRDPNLSISNDGNYLFLSCALNTGAGYTGKLYVLDAEYHVLSSCNVATATYYFVWGNVLQTPDGYLLKTEYSTTGAYMMLLRSSAPFSGSVDGMTFSSAYVFDNSQTEGRGTECTIAYHNNKLVSIWRQDRTVNPQTKIAVTTDLEGLTGWSEPTIWDRMIHAPALSQYNDDDLLTLMGSITENGERLPFIALVDTDAKALSIIKVFDTTCGGGGYPSIIRLDSTKYSTVYYDHVDNTKTRLYHRTIDIAFLPGFMALLDPTVKEIYPAIT